MNTSIVLVYVSECSYEKHRGLAAAVQLSIVIISSLPSPRYIRADIASVVAIKLCELLINIPLRGILSRGPTETSLIFVKVDNLPPRLHLPQLYPHIVHLILATPFSSPAVQDQITTVEPSYSHRCLFSIESPQPVLNKL